jgi:uncharacterized membrane protein YsdA (DUF1294 family)
MECSTIIEQKYITYFLFINILSFILFRIDKWLSQTRKVRISEQNLILISIIGGSIGSILGMYIGQHHKTNKAKFKYGIPTIFFLETSIAILKYFHLF